MVIDSSVLVALHTKEAGYEFLFAKVSQAAGAIVPAPIFLATAMVLASRLSKDPRPLLRASFEALNVTIVPFRQEHMNVAIDAFLRFGKGRHPAGLNFGDCMSYAVASLARMPLLYIGTDFSKTDVLSA